MTKQRITLKLSTLDTIEPNNLVFKEDGVMIPGSVFQKRQDRLIIPFSELPSDLIEIFENIYQFRIQWNAINSTMDELYQNFGSKGLEVNVVPSVLEYDEEFKKFNDFFKKYLPINFTSESIVSTATSATYHILTNIRTTSFQNFLKTLVPSGLDRIDYIENIDIQFNKDDKNIKISWISSPFDIILTQSDTITKELGIFEVKNYDEEDLELSGLRTSLKKRDYTPPTKTLLIIKPRHHNINTTINYSFETPIGLHPKLKVTNLSDLSKPHETCELFLYSHLENSLIFDKYQYDTRHLSLIDTWGDNDLELPKYKINQYGSIQLFQFLDIPDTLEIKYHSRYLKPSNETNEHFKFLTPSIFWACDSSVITEDYKLIEKNPWDSFGFGYESFFEDTTVFYHYTNNATVLKYEIPVGLLGDFEKVQLVTLFSVLIAVAYLLFKIVKSFTSKTTTPGLDRKKNE
ncbi:hypothetical protein WICMUC_005300 [Wickerhamomyces mucosus]|uniref:Protein PBN1 n=1 Tax=Wickerhamomyces mucosus TaxID=1378264 RepID=A0A9P8P8Y1_9ASCO|nr:hypothetical protein WICMUC_005300 [Wickerhamomyces mucosus]